MAAMGEETLFRGALQPLFGVALTSAGFALVHLRPGAEFAFVPLQGVALVFACLRRAAGYTGGRLRAFLLQLHTEFERGPVRGCKPMGGMAE